MKINKWKTIKCDIDSTTIVREINSSMNKKNYKHINRYCRKNNYRRKCGHDFDCCGCLNSVNTWFDYSNNKVSIFMKLNYNY